MSNRARRAFLRIARIRACVLADTLDGEEYEDVAAWNWELRRAFNSIYREPLKFPNNSVFDPGLVNLQYRNKQGYFDLLREDPIDMEDTLRGYAIWPELSELFDEACEIRNGAVSILDPLRRVIRPDSWDSVYVSYTAPIIKAARFVRYCAFEIHQHANQHHGGSFTKAFRWLWRSELSFQRPWPNNFKLWPDRFKRPYSLTDAQILALLALSESWEVVQGLYELGRTINEAITESCIDSENSTELNRIRNNYADWERQEWRWLFRCLADAKQFMICAQLAGVLEKNTNPAHSRTDIGEILSRLQENLSSSEYKEPSKYTEGLQKGRGWNKGNPPEPQAIALVEIGKRAGSSTWKAIKPCAERLKDNREDVAGFLVEDVTEDGLTLRNIDTQEAISYKPGAIPSTISKTKARLR